MDPGVEVILDLEASLVLVPILAPDPVLIPALALVPIPALALVPIPTLALVPVLVAGPAATLVARAGTIIIINLITTNQKDLEDYTNLMIYNNTVVIMSTDHVLY